MKKEQKKALKMIVIGIVLVLLLVGFYYYVSHKMERSGNQKDTVITKTQQVLAYNLDTRYPPSPKEVIKYYSEITQCFYNEIHTEEDLYKLAMQIQKLYDDELKGNKTEEEYLRDLKSDIASMQKNGCVVSSYSISASTDVEYFTEDGYDWARLYCIYGIRKGTTWINSEEKFLLRKDADGHWKIYGWTLADG